MSEQASNNCASNDQSQSLAKQKNQSTKIRRRLEHLADLQEGVDKFDMVPRCLSRAYFENKFPEAKYKLLRVMMSHGEYFRVKRKYLNGIFSSKTLLKYLPELISEGYLDCETLDCKTGGVMNVYHVRPITDWLVYRQTVDASQGNDRQTVDASLGKHYKDTKYPSIDPATAPMKPNDTDPKKRKTPSQRDDVFNSTCIGGKNSAADKKTSSHAEGKDSSYPSGEAVRYALSMEFLYSKRKVGSYDWKTANEAAQIFLDEFGYDSAALMRRWAESFTDIHGRVKVKERLFNWLWDQFEKTLAND